MVSQIAWVDASPEEQRRVREIIQMFSMKETQDELGGRQVVVVLSDAMFPGTSVLHTRARYLFFIPWFFKSAAARANPAKALEVLERGMIKAFRSNMDQEAADTLDGLIGRAAGEMVKQLPSTAYWTALSEWGILRHPGTIREVLAATASSADSGEADELAERRLSVWHPDIGSAPKGFPTEVLDGGFSLTASEASFLRDRWLSLPGDSMLAHLARSTTPLAQADTPWDEPLCAEANEELCNVLHLAQRFSLALEGAQLVYATMLTDRYLENGFEGVAVDADEPRRMFAEWAGTVKSISHLFNDWDSGEFWDFVRARNPRISEHTVRFFDEWFAIVAAGPQENLIESEALRKAIGQREIFIKKPAQSRIANPTMLAAWRGATSARTVYRWSQVKRLVTDVHTGLGVTDVRA